MKRNTPKALLALIAALALCHGAARADLPQDVAAQLEQQNIVWESPSADAKGSMPIGNGDLGLNVWVEPSGDLCFFIGKSDAWNENMTLCKVGKVRVKFTPALVEEGQPFEWKLDLKGGRIVIKTAKAEVVLWVDAHHNVVQVDATGNDGQKLEASAAFELWRKEKRLLRRGLGAHPESWHEPGCKRFVYPDTVLKPQGAQVGWYHRNPESSWMETLEIQNIKEIAETTTDPLLNRTFGAIIRGGSEGSWKTISDTELRAAPAEKLSLRVHVLTAITDSAKAWEEKIQKQADAVDRLDAAARATAHAKWWGDFWNRSWIFVEGSGEPKAAALPFEESPWRVGVDSHGGNRFAGQITGPQISGKALTAEEITALAGQDPATETKLVQEQRDTGLTLTAWIKPENQSGGRILDNSIAGTANGMLLDMPGGPTLRLMVGAEMITKPGCLTPGEWQHVAATVNAVNGDCRLYVNGKMVLEKTVKLPGMQSANQIPRLTQAYTLQRFINAGAGRGAYPIKFNGSLFTVDNTPYGPDYRQWGGGYWLQNTRLPYWSMLEAGDFDLMRPLFDHYFRLLPIRKLATKKYYGHDGAYFPETTTIWGSFLNENYGTNRKGLPDGLTTNAYIRYHWTGGLELVTMMLDYHDMTGDEAFRKETLIPFAKEMITFFDQHWKRGEDGKIRFAPAQSLETWFNVLNPTPDIAALLHNIPRLLAKTDDPALKAAWQKTLDDLPPLPMRVDPQTGEKHLLPAQTFGKATNFENPTLYPVFPFRMFSVASDAEGLAVGRQAWEVRRNPGLFGWGQDSIHAAALGLSDEARAQLLRQLGVVAPGFRFPAMWGPNFDWIPDQDHGGVMNIAFQYMAIQYAGDKILVLPAWPKDWDTHFKLHAPKNTQVECKVEGGKITLLKVTPESRRKDVVLPEGWKAP